MTTRKNFINLTGQTFGRLTVVRRQENTKEGIAKWECLCECGKYTICRGSRLRSGETKSCGCIYPGTSIRPEYRTWQSMKDRCLNPNNRQFKDYGGRGVRMYDNWIESFTEFYKYVGPKPTSNHTIDRINNNIGYFPGNVKWSTVKEQNNNKRNNLIITFNNKSATLAQWAEFIGISKDILNQRIHRGWPIEKAFTHPVRKQMVHQSHIAPSS
jgi:hypothetical protein